MENNVEKLNNYTLGRELGTGANCRVRYCTLKGAERPFALKLMNKATQSNADAMLKEYAALKELVHPHIVKLYEISDTGVYKSRDGSSKAGMLYSVLEFADNGELFDYVALDKFGERFARYFFKQLIDAVGHCHSQGFAHR
jgi:serine/threonine protein kinase